jgi:pyruvate ferredoxin oxidoreductase alpha subunit
MQALDLIPQISGEFAERFGRRSGSLVQPYRTEDAETIIVALGSVLGTVEDVVDEQRDQGHLVGALGIGCFRPFPSEAIRAALQHAERVIVLEKAFAIGIGGIASMNVRSAMHGIHTDGHTVIAGLGGRPITKKSLHGVLEEAMNGRLGQLTFLDLDHGMVERELDRQKQRRRSGPYAENILRDVGAIAARPVLQPDDSPV